MNLQTITSLGNPNIKRVVKLRKKRLRLETQRFVFEGQREYQRALDRDIQITDLFLCPHLAKNYQDIIQQTLVKTGPTSPNVFKVEPEIYAKLAMRDEAEGIVVVARYPSQELSDLVLSESPLVLVLEDIEKPGNVGALLRSATAAGAEAVFVTDPEFDFFSPNVIRSSLGHVFSLPALAADRAAVIRLLAERSLTIFPTIISSKSEVYWEQDFRNGCAFVLGSEAGGLSPDWGTMAGQLRSVPIQIPMAAVDSLNVAACGAVLLYEAMRQRHLQAPSAR